MTVVSDTSPISNLLQIDRLDLLEKLFNHVLIPHTVYLELCELPAQKIALAYCTWIVVRKASQQKLLDELTVSLDPGEAEAITLALELKADYLLIDERKGRHIAETLGLRIVGLLGILLQAKEKGYLTAVEPALIELRKKAGFRIHPDLYERVLTLAGERD